MVGLDTCIGRTGPNLNFSLIRPDLKVFLVREKLFMIQLDQPGHGCFVAVGLSAQPGN